MKSISKRTYFALALACILIFGLIAFTIRYFMSSGKWVVFSGSPHVYTTGGTVSAGVITDANGVMILDSTGSVTYSEDEAIRKSTIHLVGDRQGYIDDRIIPTYASYMIGYDTLNGTNGTGEGSLQLTVLAEAQKAALTALDGRKGTVGVMNYKTGEILCAVTSPSYDPDNLPESVDEDSGIYINRFFYSSYTPGSIFKLLTTSAAIETVPGILDRKFTCTGSCYYNGEKITCPKAHGELTYKEALAKSCNCAFSEIANEVGKETLQEYAEKAGVTNTLVFDGIYTKAGRFDVGNADKNDLAWAGIGQYTNLVNPCEYLTFVGAIGNDGVQLTPHIVKTVKTGAKVTYTAGSPESRRILEQTTTKKLTEMMHYNAEKIYNTSTFPSGLRVCAKSGTAEVSDVRDNTATFAGFIDSEEYPLAFIVVVEEGRAGSDTCAPIAGTVISACVEAMP